MLKRTYKNCDELPLHNFIKVLTTDDKRYLLKEYTWYKATPNLDDVWEAIFYDYLDRINDTASQRAFLNIKSLTLLSDNINIAVKCVGLLSKGVDLVKFKPTIDALKSTLGVYAQFSEASLVKDLKQCIAKIKLLKTNYKTALEEYKSSMKDEKEKVKEVDFTEQIVVLEQFLKFSIDPKITTVAKYISYLNTLKDSNKNG